MMREVSDSELGGRRLDELLGRGVGADAGVGPRVAEILERVRSEGDTALRSLTSELDGVDVGSSLRLDPSDIAESARQCPESVREAIRRAARAIYRFHRPQRLRNQRLNAGSRSRVAQEVRPLSAVGLYVPGGRAIYPSSVLMNAIPARVAGVERIVVVTPPSVDGIAPPVAAALRELELDEVYGIGGAQAVAALAFGTDSVPRVDKIVGPGNAWVAEAKRQVFGHVDIDAVAGPSEAVVVADESANPVWVASELLAQAEHDPDACVVAVVTSAELAGDVVEQVEAQTEQAARKDIIGKSLSARGGVIRVSDVAAGIALANRIAPEHLVLMVERPRRYLASVTSAGCVFLGPFSPVALGDYAAGPNHVLPTGGAARFASALSAYDFVKCINVVEFTRDDLRRRAQTVIDLACAEGLQAHARSVQLRFDDTPEES